MSALPDDAGFPSRPPGHEIDKPGEEEDAAQPKSQCGCRGTGSLSQDLMKIPSINVETVKVLVEGQPAVSWNQPKQ